MKQRTRVTKSKKSGRVVAGAGRKSGRRKGLSLNASVEESKRRPVSLGDVLEFYKPIKKPVTLRLDADVLAWFKRDGRRYHESGECVARCCAPPSGPRSTPSSLASARHGEPKNSAGVAKLVGVLFDRCH
jgi:uncharacterized protein (DUF4415 family)